MGRQNNVTGYYIEVHPRHVGNLGGVIVSDSFFYPDKTKLMKRYKELCESIESDIRRHVDGVGSVHLITESEDVCEFCGWTWENKDAPHNGGCCWRDTEVLEAFEKEKENLSKE